MSCLNARDMLRQLRSELADLGDGDWLSIWLEEPQLAAPLEEITFIAAAMTRRLEDVRAGVMIIRRGLLSGGDSSDDLSDGGDLSDDEKRPDDDEKRPI